MTARALLAAALVTLACSLFDATPASASRVGVDTVRGQLWIGSDLDDPRNEFTVTLADPCGNLLWATCYTIVDRGSAFSFAPAGFCEYVVDTSTVRCNASGITRIEVVLQEGNDALMLKGVPTPAKVFGGAGDDELSGGDDKDALSGEEGADTLDGGGGDDSLFSDRAASDQKQTARGTLLGGPGKDVLIGTDGEEVFDGGEGPDEIRGFGGRDVISGGDDDDFLNGADGSDEIYGGPGNDRLGTFLNSAPGTEPLERGDDTLDGGPGDDVLRPGAGPESGFSDNDLLSGGAGTDTVEYQRRTEPVHVSIDGAANDGQAGEADNVDPSVEKLIGSSRGDVLVGTPGDDIIDGAGGDDIIDGLGGNDALEGGTVDGGSDRLIGGAGNDALSGSAGDDFIDGHEGNDTASGGSGADTIVGGAGVDRLLGDTGSDTLSGSGANDDLDGGDGSDLLEGGDGNDRLRGGRDGDVLRGGSGADDLSGDDGSDAAEYQIAARVKVTLDNVADDGSPGERDNVRTDVEVVRGGGQQDTFFGSGRGNTLDGAAGEDYVDGRAGPDELRGGGARDVIRARDGARDVVDCGRSVDLAIVDRMDEVSGNCERASDGVSDRPQQGEDLIVDPVRGTNELDVLGMKRTVPLEDRIEVPVGSSVDASDGRVSLTTEGSRARRQSGQFYGGRIRIVQDPDESLTVLRLEGGESCGGGGSAKVRMSLRRSPKKGRGGWTGTGKKGSASSTRAARGRASRTGPGRFRTVGVFSSATVSRRSVKGDGAVWLTQDRCDGTLTRVVSGAVDVRDFDRARTLTLTAGERYLARAPR